MSTSFLAPLALRHCVPSGNGPDTTAPRRRRFQFISSSTLYSSHAIVVGAGVAGLTAAKHLANEGHSVTILEASDGVGGRIRSDVVDGFILDRGFQVFIEGYPQCKERFVFSFLCIILNCILLNCTC